MCAPDKPDAVSKKILRHKRSQMSNLWGSGKTERTWAMLRDGFGNKGNLPGAGMNNDLLDTDIIVNVGWGHAVMQSNIRKHLLLFTVC